MAPKNPKPDPQTQALYDSMLVGRKQLWHQALRVSLICGCLTAVVLLILAATVL